MGRPIYITDPVVAAQYKVHPAEFAYVASDLEAAWLIAKRHGYGLNNPTALPAAYYVHALAPMPFVPYAQAGQQQEDPDCPPAPRRGRQSAAKTEG